MALIQTALRVDPSAVARVKREMTQGAMGGIYDMDRFCTTAEATIREVNAFMQGWRVLCVTTQRDSERMWSGYSENHKESRCASNLTSRRIPSFRSSSRLSIGASGLHYNDDTLESSPGASLAITMRATR